MPEMPTNSSQQLCIGCGHSIKDQYIYKVQPDMQWHESCLKCSECNCRLEENSTCFVRNGKAFCKTDYTRLFAAKCNKCSVSLKRNDLIMKSKSKVYHLECFCCVICSKKLMPGEEYYQAKDGLLYCKEDSASILLFNPYSAFNQNQYLSSTMSVTPESSVTSSSFSPSTGSSSSSSIVDSPSNYNQTGLGYQPFHLQQQLRTTEKYTENDSYQDKEEDNSVSDDESNLNQNNNNDDDLIDHEDDDQDVSISEDDESISFNSDSKKHKKHSNKHQSKKIKHHASFSSTSSPNSNYLQNCFSSGSSSGKPARIRTVLNEKQLHTLRACYGANPRPDALMKEQLVEMTGLNPRVIRVWFQNKRCKDKKKNMLVRPSDHMNPSMMNGQFMHQNGSAIQLPTHPMFDSCF